MTDTYLGQTRPNWISSTGIESITSNMDFITIYTGVDIRTAAQVGGSAASQANLNKLLEIVSERGQPVIMGSVGLSSSQYTLVLAIEHLGWSVMQTGNVVLATTSGTTSSTTINITGALATAGLVVGMQAWGAGILTPSAVIPTIASISTNAVVLSASQASVASGATITFIPPPVSTGLRLVDRIVADGVNYGFPADATASTLGVLFTSVLT